MDRNRLGWFLAALLTAAAGCGKEPCVEASGKACVWAGTGELAQNGDGHELLGTSFYWPLDVEFAPDDVPWIIDWNNHLIRRLTANGTVETVIGNFLGDGPPDQSDLTPAGAEGLTVNLNHPTDLQFRADGTLEFAAWHNHKIRECRSNDLRVTVLAGRGPGFAGDGGPVAQALFNQPKAIVVAPDGSMYVLDQRNLRVRRVAADGTITTVVGTGMAGFAGDGGPPAAAQLKFEVGSNPQPSGALALDAAGRLYISDGLNHRIRRVDFAANTITTIAGTGQAGFSGDGGPATDAQINNPRDLEFGPDGRLYLADTENHRVRVLDLGTGVIDTYAGTGTSGMSGDGMAAREVELDRPFGISFDHRGNLYIADTFHSRIVKVPR